MTKQHKHFRISNLGKKFKAGRRPKDVALVLGIIIGLATFIGWWFIDISLGAMLFIVLLLMILFTYGMSRGEGRK